MPGDDARAELSADDIGSVVQARDISGGVHVHRPRPGAPPPRQLPGDVHGFVNRTGELRSLDRALDEQDRRTPITLVVGTAGVGKTSLAVHWAHSRRDRFPDGQLYADLRGHAPDEPVTPLRVLEGFLPALLIRREAGDREGEALSLNDLGLVYLRSRRLDEAREMFERGMRVYRALDDSHWEAVLAANLGEARAERGDLDGAETMVRHALALFRERAERGGEGNALRLLAMIRRSRSDVPGALEAAGRAVAIARDHANPAWEGYWLLELARAQREAGDAGAALAGCRRSVELHRQVGDRVREALAWDGYGEAGRETSRLEEAEHAHRRTVGILRGYGDNRWPLALALNNLATVLTELDRRPEALAPWADALHHLTGFTDPAAVRLRARIEHALHP